MAKRDRLISIAGSEIDEMDPMRLKASILKSEGRVICGQHLLFANTGLVRGVTNSELMFAFGADMVMLNTYNFDDESANLGMQGLSFAELKALCRRPIGIYLGCPGANAATEDGLYDRNGMLATPEHVAKAIEMGASFVVLGGNPGSGTRIADVLATTKRVKDEFGDKVFLWAGKWEDGVTEPVLGDPLAKAQGRDDKQVIAQLIDAGADCIDLPAPGCRGGITVEMVRELVEFTHSYKPGTLAMTFLNSSIEGADTDTVREVAILMKQTGADIHCIGDGGFAGCSSPENVQQLSFSIKGKPYTYYRMASVNR